MTSDPKPEPRRVATPEEWAELHAQLRLVHGGCQVSGSTELLTAHHLVPRSLGGDDVFENLALVNGSGTTGVHGLIEAKDPETLVALRRALTPEQLEYIVAKKGKEFLDRYYPLGLPDMQTTVYGDEVPHEHVVRANGVEKTCSKCKGKGKVIEKPKPEGAEQAPERPKTTWSVRVPKDERENGYAVLEELMEAAVERAAELGLVRDVNKGANYYTLVAALHSFVTGGGGE